MNTLTTTKTTGNEREVTQFWHDANGNKLSQMTHTIAPATDSAASAGFGGEGWQLNSCRYNSIYKVAARKCRLKMRKHK